MIKFYIYKNKFVFCFNSYFPLSINSLSPPDTHVGGHCAPPDQPIPATPPTGKRPLTELSTPASPLDQSVVPKPAGIARIAARRRATQRLSHRLPAKLLRYWSSPAQPSPLESPTAPICFIRPTFQLRWSRVRNSTVVASCATSTPRLSCQPPGVTSLSSGWAKTSSETDQNIFVLYEPFSSSNLSRPILVPVDFAKIQGHH